MAPDVLTVPEAVAPRVVAHATIILIARWSLALEEIPKGGTWQKFQTLISCAMELTTA